MLLMAVLTNNRRNERKKNENDILINDLGNNI